MFSLSVQMAFVSVFASYDVAAVVVVVVVVFVATVDVVVDVVTVAFADVLLFPSLGEGPMISLFVHKSETLHLQRC